VMGLAVDPREIYPFPGCQNWSPYVKRHEYRAYIGDKISPVAPPVGDCSKFNYFLVLPYLINHKILPKSVHNFFEFSIFSSAVGQKAL